MRGVIGVPNAVSAGVGAASSQASLSERVASSLSPAELCVHMLAQVPEHVHLTIPDVAEAPRLLQIAAAYGVHERVRVHGGSRQPRFEQADTAAELSIPTHMTLGELAEAIAPGEGVFATQRRADPMLSGHRVVLLTNYPAHHRLPLFSSMSERLLSVGAELNVVFLARQATSRPWLVGNNFEFEHEFLSSTRLPLGHRGTLIPYNLERRLTLLRPTIVVVASLSPFVGLRTAWVARRVGAHFGIWSGETPQMTTARGRTCNLVRGTSSAVRTSQSRTGLVALATFAQCELTCRSSWAGIQPPFRIRCHPGQARARSGSF